MKPSAYIGKTQRSTLLVGLTGLLLLVLAILQYRWIDELSAFEREERERNLETSAEGVVRTLDREFENIQSAFRVPRSCFVRVVPVPVPVPVPSRPRSRPRSRFHPRTIRWRNPAPLSRSSSCRVNFAEGAAGSPGCFGNGDGDGTETRDEYPFHI